MRYFDFALRTNSDDIREKAEKTGFNLKEYAFCNAIAAVNNYMYRNLKTGIFYCMYREGSLLGGRKWE